MNFEVDRISCGYLKNIDLFRLRSDFSGSRPRLAAAVLAALLGSLAAPTNGRASVISAPPAAFQAPKAAEAGPRSPSRTERATPAEKHAVPRQYHDGTPPISRSIALSIVAQKCCWIARPISTKTAATGFVVEEAPRYQRIEARYQRDRMLRIGAVLGVTYVLFVAIWLWATRFRAR
jgi:hypothetical protein